MNYYDLPRWRSWILQNFSVISLFLPMTANDLWFHFSYSPFPSSFSVSPFSVSCTGCDELKGGGDSHLAFQNSTDLRYTGYTLPETNSEFTPANEFRFGIWIFSLLGVWPGPIFFRGELVVLGRITGQPFFFRWSHGAPPILVVIVAWCRSGCKTCGMYRRRHLGDAFASSWWSWTKNMIKNPWGVLMDWIRMDQTWTWHCSRLLVKAGYVHNLYDFRADKNLAVESWFVICHFVDSGAV